jgi:hypothetical protein
MGIASKEGYGHPQPTKFDPVGDLSLDDSACQKCQKISVNNTDCEAMVERT